MLDIGLLTTVLIPWPRARPSRPRKGCILWSSITHSSKGVSLRLPFLVSGSVLFLPLFLPRPPSLPSSSTSPLSLFCFSRIHSTHLHMKCAPMPLGYPPRLIGIDFAGGFSTEQRLSRACISERLCPITRQGLQPWTLWSLICHCWLVASRSMLTACTSPSIVSYHPA
jgi:hypothetical protein